QEFELETKLLKLHPWAKKGSVFLTGTGDAAMELALCCARRYTNKGGIAFCDSIVWSDCDLDSSSNDINGIDVPSLFGIDSIGSHCGMDSRGVSFKYNDIDSFNESVKMLSDDL